jgi:hypothetical protein
MMFAPYIRCSTILRLRFPLDTVCCLVGRIILNDIWAREAYPRVTRSSRVCRLEYAEGLRSPSQQLRDSHTVQYVL